MKLYFFIIISIIAFSTVLLPIVVSIIYDKKKRLTIETACPYNSNGIFKTVEDCWIFSGKGIALFFINIAILRIQYQSWSFIDIFHLPGIKRFEYCVLALGAQ